MSYPTFIPVEEALALVQAHARSLPAERVPLERAGGRVLAETLICPLDLPPFDNSAMDGYALRWEDGRDTWRLAGAIAAGDWPELGPGPGECLRIFTGAPLPPGTDCVIQQEWVEEMDGQVRLLTGIPKRGDHIRPRASHIAAGETAMSAGYFLRPGAVGFLAHLGLTEVAVHRQARVSLIITGSELAEAGVPLRPGQIYESNSQTLIAALAELGLQSVMTARVPDDPEVFAMAFHRAVAQSDLVLLTGGISVGDHDVVRLHMERGEMETIFYKVRQRPGKPMYFGRSGSCLLMGLPGNPASVLNCFYQYAWPALRIMGGYRQVLLPRISLRLASPFTKKSGLTFFLKGRISGDEVIPLEGQLSYIMRSFGEADALIVLPGDRDCFEAGEPVEVQVLPHGLP
jgi:molybdopterin molybdotransferase